MAPLYWFKYLLLALFAIVGAGQLNGLSPQVVRFEGYLGEMRLQNALKTIQELHNRNFSILVLEINSTSGDIKEVFKVAQEIYQLKMERELTVIAYIQENAVGPAALLPFLADALYISPLVSWGAIPLDSEEAIPTNLLKSRATSLIPPNHPKAELLKAVASAMCDPSLTLSSKGTLHLRSENAKNDESSPYIISTKGETLVLNHNALSRLGLIAEALSLDAFRAQIESAPPAEKSGEKGESLPAEQGGLERELKKHISINPEGETLIGHILIDDKQSGINQSTWIYVKSALEYYKKLKPAFIILELNTPGGEVFAAQNISDALQSIDFQNNIPVIAFIDNWAISAGAMLAYSCRFIATSKDGSMGAAEPVIMGEGGQMQTASEKINSALRTDFANRARFFNRNPYIAEAMVDKDILLVFRHGKVIRLDKEDQIRLKGLDPDKIVSAKGKLLTLSAEEMIEYGVADMLLQPAKLGAITSKEASEGKWPFSKELLSKAPFFSKIPNAKIDAYRMDWRTRFFAFLALPLVSSLLMMGVLVGIYFEFTSPGFGVPGTIGLTCLLLLIIANLSLDIANWLDVILVFIGLGLIAFEIFVFPTTAILGIIGGLFFLGGLFGMMLPGIDKIHFEIDTQTLNAAGQEFFKRLSWMCGTLIAAFFLAAYLSRYITPNLSGLNRLVLAGREQNASEGYIAGENPENLPKPGTQGEVLATLRPAGKVIFQDTIYDAVTNGEFIEKGEQVLVERIEGSVIIVRGCLISKLNGEIEST